MSNKNEHLIKVTPVWSAWVIALTESAYRNSCSLMRKLRVSGFAPARKVNAAS